MTIELPVLYDELTPYQRKKVRTQYVDKQNGKCWFCKEKLSEPPLETVTKLKLNMRQFPPGFLKSPVHLQHDHVTGYTEGAVHGYCNAVLWQYYGR